MKILVDARWPVAALCLLLLPNISFAASGRVECNSLPSKILARPVPYCVLLPPSYDADKARSFPILYFFHGLGDDEQMFVHTGGWNLVEDLWERKQLGEFLIATPAAGATFYINSHDGKARSPIVMARAAPLASLKIYFDCGDEDDFGFESGATALDRVLKSRKIPHEFHLYPGRHDWQYFAAHLPASLQFHSRLFEKK